MNWACVVLRILFLGLLEGQPKGKQQLWRPFFLPRTLFSTTPSSAEVILLQLDGDRVREFVNGELELEQVSSVAGMGFLFGLPLYL